MLPVVTTRRRFLSRGLAGLGVVGSLGSRSGLVWGQTASAVPSIGSMIDRAIKFLRPRQDAKGGWSTQREPGITALVVTALLRSGQVPAGRSHGDPRLQVPRRLHWCEGRAIRGPSCQLLDLDRPGGVPAGQRQRALRSGDQGRARFPQVHAVGRKRRESRETTRFTAGRDTAAAIAGQIFQHRFLHGSPADTGLPADDPNLQKALVFVSRCQNLKSEFNDQAWAGKINDGGFIYTAAQGGSSMAGKEANGGLRSYASMTYAGLKSMIYAGLSREDPRVKAALTYITQPLLSGREPGAGTTGTVLLLSHVRQDDVSARDADDHGCRGAVARLARRADRGPGKRQQADGSWVNPADRFMEGDPNLVTAYALLALAYTRPQTKRS